jgi:hypothetical protein
MVRAMNHKTIVAVLAGLTGLTLTLGCDKTKSDVTEVPGATQPEAAEAAPASESEHACGNHAEGECGSDDEAAPEAALANSHTFEVAPGKFAEANFRMGKDSTVTVTFAKGSGELAWDVHSHDHSGGTNIHDKGAGGAGSVSFTAPEDGVFSVLWRNEGASATPLEVSVELGDGASLHSWTPE